MDVPEEDPVQLYQLAIHDQFSLVRSGLGFGLLEMLQVTFHVRDAWTDTTMAARVRLRKRLLHSESEMLRCFTPKMRETSLSLSETHFTQRQILTCMELR